MDFVSLYPSVTVNTKFPVSHGRVTVIPPDQTKVNWTSAAQNPYKGILKVLVEPPRRTLVPVLPKRFANDERLLFALCPLCSETYRKRRAPSGTQCRHTSEERCFVVTLPHIEINEALENGYTVREVYRVWEFDRFDDTLFAEYVRDFLRLKVEASGYPEEVVTDEQKQRYIDMVEQREGIRLDAANIRKNPGLRYVQSYSLTIICLF